MARSHGESILSNAFEAYREEQVGVRLHLAHIFSYQVGSRISPRRTPFVEVHLRGREVSGFRSTFIGISRDTMHIR